MIQAIQDNLFEFWGSLRKSPNTRVEDTDEMLRYSTSAPFPLLNGVMRARFQSGEADRKVQEALDLFRQGELPMWWWTTPSDSPIDLPQRLVAAGLAETGQSPGMALDLAKLDDSLDPPPGLVVERLGSDDDLSEYSRVLAAGYGMPEFVTEDLARHLKEMGSWPEGPCVGYLARLEGAPVATSLVAFAAGVAGIYYVATLPTARRQGIGTAVTAAPLREARQLGNKIAILHSSPMGYGVYRRLGFREYCMVGRYVWAPPKSSEGQA